MTRTESKRRWAARSPDKIREQKARYDKSFLGRLTEQRWRFKASLPLPELSPRMQSILARQESALSRIVLRREVGERFRASPRRKTVEATKASTKGKMRFKSMGASEPVEQHPTNIDPRSQTLGEAATDEPMGSGFGKNNEALEHAYTSPPITFAPTIDELHSALMQRLLAKELPI